MAVANFAQGDLDGFRAVLARSRLLPAPEIYRALRGEVGRRGQALRDELRSSVGSRRWEAALHALGRPLAGDAVVRVLGFGDVLTRFSVAPLRLTEEHEDAVARLGARANLIVTLYDELADREPRADPLPPRVVARLARGRGPGVWFGAARRGPRGFLVAAVAGYFRAVAGLPAARYRPNVARALVRAVLRMHAAERASVQGTLPSSLVMRRKAALPFVVMGMPGWLASPAFDRRVYLWHLGWLFRLGRFFGHIDDVVDLGEDLAAGRANPFAAGGESTLRSLTDLAALGRSLLEEWQLRVDQKGDRLPQAVREAVPVCIASWLGGLPTLTSTELGRAWTAPGHGVVPTGQPNAPRIDAADASG